MGVREMGEGERGWEERGGKGAECGLWMEVRFGERGGYDWIRARSGEDRRRDVLVSERARFDSWEMVSLYLYHRGLWVRM